jgi:hypothetical protein
MAENNSTVLLSSAARTATVATADQSNPECRGVVVIINVTADPASASVVATIQGKDELSGVYYTILTSAAIAAVGTTVLRVFPGATAATNVTANDVLPSTWRVNFVHADTDSITYSAAAQLIV